MSYLIYFLILLIVPLYAQMRVKSTFRKYSQVGSTSNLTGAEVARKILNENGLFNVAVEETRGYLSDHYDPRAKVVRLSTENYHGYSVAGTAVAAHEVGHAIQDANDYSFLRFRHSLVPVANFSSNFSYIFIIIGMLSRLSGALLIGIVLLALGVLFQVVTLPVEFNASSRALKQITTLGIINSNEHVYAKRVLNAAALTYVAAAAVAVAELLRLVLIYTGMTRSDD
ncbi:flagellar biosynthesis protein FlgM [Bacillus sp. FJAT-25509]|uniref:zinc metallopeptidase n=1 Tax=Bacillaceae TaxID=186817 RepID=UPI0006FAA0B0|nr:zinc metallopeptidase [Bacillus sp. FJAT-25509]KQL42241.1 flagellar biosynthesis protein FlgM [Bacillus sp. FJAT-25509]